MFQFCCTVWMRKKEKVEVALGIKAWEICTKSEERQVANENKLPPNPGPQPQETYTEIVYIFKEIKKSPGNTKAFQHSKQHARILHQVLHHSTLPNLFHTIFLRKIMNWLTSSPHSTFTVNKEFYSLWTSLFSQIYLQDIAGNQDFGKQAWSSPSLPERTFSPLFS